VCACVRACVCVNIYLLSQTTPSLRKILCDMTRNIADFVIVLTAYFELYLPEAF
jgi:hypothetical protein